MQNRVALPPPSASPSTLQSPIGSPTSLLAPTVPPISHTPSSALHPDQPTSLPMVPIRVCVTKNCTNILSPHRAGSLCSRCSLGVSGHLPPNVQHRHMPAPSYPLHAPPHLNHSTKARRLSTQHKGFASIPSSPLVRDPSVPVAAMFRSRAHPVATASLDSPQAQASASSSSQIPAPSSVGLKGSVGADGAYARNSSLPKLARSTSPDRHVISTSVPLLRDTPSSSGAFQPTTATRNITASPLGPVSNSISQLDTLLPNPPFFDPLARAPSNAGSGLPPSPNRDMSLDQLSACSDATSPDMLFHAHNSEDSDMTSVEEFVLNTGATSKQVSREVTPQLSKPAAELSTSLSTPTVSIGGPSSIHTNVFAHPEPSSARSPHRATTDDTTSVHSSSGITTPSMSVAASTSSIPKRLPRVILRLPSSVSASNSATSLSSNSTSGSDGRKLPRVILKLPSLPSEDNSESEPESSEDEKDRARLPSFGSLGLDWESDVSDLTSLEDSGEEEIGSEVESEADVPVSFQQLLS